MSKLTLYRWMSLVGYFALLTLILNWLTWIDPPKQLPRSFVLIVLTVPLLIPLHGIVHGKRRTHQWVIFLSAGYFLIGVDTWFTQIGLRSVLGAAMTLFSIVLFVGCSGYGKHSGPVREPKEIRKARRAAEDQAEADEYAAAQAAKAAARASAAAKSPSSKTES